MITVVVEGESDRQAAIAVVRAAGHEVDSVRVAKGKSRLDGRIPKYRAAAVHAAWVVFRDSDGDCPVALRQRLESRTGVRSTSRFALRIAHSMTEAWLLADVAGFAEYFRVSPQRVPPAPEVLPNAKRKLLDLCARSRSRAIREEVVTSDHQTGPLYVEHINEFAARHWQVDRARGHSPSLDRAVTAIAALPT
ncbi:MAG: hypothetical protein ACK5LS_02720 [Propioniciclava sp.]